MTLAGELSNFFYTFLRQVYALDRKKHRSAKKQSSCFIQQEMFKKSNTNLGFSGFAKAVVFAF